MRVLIAESDRTRMRRIHEILETDGRFQAVADSADGDSAVKDASGADVIIIDRDIQGRGWLGTVSEVLRMERPPAIVVLTPITKEAVHEAARREGVNDVVVWPSQAPDLPERLAALERRMN